MISGLLSCRRNAGILAAFVLVTARFCFAAVPVAMDGYLAECGVEVRQAGERLSVVWGLGDGKSGEMRFDLRGTGPLIEALIARPAKEAIKEGHPALKNLDPVVFVTVGSRKPPADKPPDQKWMVFFDKPADRPHETFAGRLELK